MGLAEDNEAFFKEMTLEMRCRTGGAKSGLGPVDYILWYFETNDPDIVPGRQQSMTGIGKGKKLAKVIEEIYERGFSGSSAIQEAFSSACTDAIMREIQRTDSSYTASTQIEPEDLTDEALTEARLDLRQSLPFLSKILAPVAQATDLATEQPEDEEGSDESEADDDRADSMPGIVRVTANQHRTGLAERRQRKKETRRRMRADNIVSLALSMLTFSRNRRQNAVAKFFGLYALVTGTSNRMADFLWDHGVANSRKYALRAGKTLAAASADALKTTVQSREERRLGSDLTFDNVNVTDGVTARTIDHKPKQHNGTVILSLDSSYATPEAFDVERLKQWTASKPAIACSEFVPSPESTRYFDRHVVMLHACRALSRALEKKKSKVQVPKEWLKARPVDLVDAQRAKLNIFRLSEVSDASMKDMGPLLDDIREQMGLTRDEFAGSVRVMNGDGGSKMLMESFRAARHPAEHPYDGLASVVTVLGGGHIFWTVCIAVYRLHMAYKCVSREGKQGSLRLMGEIAGMQLPPPNSKVRDYTRVVRLLLDVGEMELVDLMLIILKRDSLEKVTQADLSPGRFEAIRNSLMTGWFEGRALHEARKTDAVLYASMLRLRDLVRIMEAHHASQCGDIGRLFYVYEAWCLLCNGVTGCSHYRRLLPNLLLQIRVLLPGPLREYIKRTFLINPSGRPDAFVTRDYHMETMIFWVKFFWSINGAQNWERLVHMISSNVLLFRDLMQQMKRGAGRPVIQVEHDVRFLTEESLDRLLAHMRDHRLHSADEARHHRIETAGARDDVAPTQTDHRTKEALPLIDVYDAEHAGWLRIAKLATSDRGLEDFRYPHRVSEQGDSAADHSAEAGMVIDDNDHLEDVLEQDLLPVPSEFIDA